MSDRPHHVIIRSKKTKKLNRNSQYNQKLKKNLNNIIKEIENLGKLTELPPHLYIKAIKLPPSERSMIDLQYIKYFLDHSKLADKFKMDNFKKESLDQLLTLCAAQLKYYHLEKDTILFRIGEEPDNFYLILNGKVGVLKPTPKEEEMTGLGYFQHLLNLKKTKEIYILKKTIEKNKLIFDIDYNDIDIISSIVMKILVEDYFSIGIKLAETRTIEDILKLCGFKVEYFGVFFDHERRNDKEYVERNERIILKNLPQFKNEIINRYRNLTSEAGNFTVTTYDYESIVELGNNFFFGDTALDKTTTRNATIKTVVDTDFCYLELDYYKSYLRNEKQRLTMKEVTFLINNFCFVKLTPHYFEKKFLNNFLYEERFENEFIIKDGQEAKFVYFIKEGCCDVYINKNVFEIHNLISYLAQLETDPKYNVNNILLECKNDFHSLKDKLSQIQKTKLFCVNNIDILGLESLFFGLNYLYNVKTTSRQVKYYKLELKFLLEIMQEEPTCYYICKSDCIKKMNILIQRLTNLNQTKIEMIDSNETVNGRKLRSEIKDNNKEEIKLEFGEINYEKNQLKMLNEYQKKFNLEKEHYTSKKFSTKLFYSPKKDIKINFYKNQLDNNSILPFIPKNITNSTSFRTNNSIEQPKNLFVSKFGFPKEKVMIRQLEKELENDKLFYTLHPRKNKIIDEILKDDKIFVFPSNKKLNVFKNNSEKNKKYTIYTNEDNIYNNSKYISTNSNISNYFPISTKSQFTVDSTINNDDDIPFINKNYKPLKSYSGRFMKEKVLSYRKFKMKMSQEDLWENMKKEKNCKTNIV